MIGRMCALIERKSHLTTSNHYAQYFNKNDDLISSMF